MNGLDVYEIGTEVTRFRSLLFDLPAIPETCLFFHDGPKGSAWPRPPVYFDNYMAPAPDVWDLSAGATIATTPNVLECLEPFVSTVAELLPLENHTGEDLELIALNLVNILDIEQCINLSRGEDERRRRIEEAAADLEPSDAESLMRGFSEGDPWPVMYPDFAPDCLKEPTFFTLSRLGTIFCLERDDRDDSLMRRIVNFGITGLTFRKVWSSATGPEHVNLFRA